MIIPMHKYYFLVFHKEYKKFLEEIQQLGALHVVKKETEATNEIKQKYADIEKLEKTIDFLDKREIPQSEEVLIKPNGLEITNDIIQKQNELEILTLQLEETNKELKKAEPWGDFSHDLLSKLKEKNIHLKFLVAPKKSFTQLHEKGLPVEIISEKGNLTYFILIQKDNEDFNIETDVIKSPEIPCSDLKTEINRLENSIKKIEKSFDLHATESVPAMEEYRMKLIKSLQYDLVIQNTSVEAEDKLMILEGWVPVSKKAQMDEFVSQSSALFHSRKATPKDNIPVLLKNNWFSKLFEPIGSMFSLPDYNELDLTIFFAPFFMLFFGFCLGDAGYGLLFIFGAGLYKIKANKNVKPYLSLIQFLGLATVIFGAISGTFFGINLIEAEFSWTANIKSLFLNPDKMFNLALVLGAIQIIFGLFIKAANQTKQFGFSYALATIGWLIILLGSVIYLLLVNFEIIIKNKTILYGIISLGGFFILFFSDPSVNVFSRVGKGIWDVYSTVTGIFGDLLSYIRLFALGLSSAILGFVINDIALQILGSSKILGPVFFVVFLLLGHTLNILISSLGSFVHPMRLTFVEFYKNAGFKGGGEEYKPFAK